MYLIFCSYTKTLIAQTLRLDVLILVMSRCQENWLVYRDALSLPLPSLLVPTSFTAAPRSILERNFGIYCSVLFALYNYYSLGIYSLV